MHVFTSRRSALILAYAALLLACGSYGGPSGGGDGLPTRAIGPWDFARESAEPDAPFASVLPETQQAARLFGHRLDDGRILLARTETDDALWAVRTWSSTDGRTFEEAETLLTAEDLDETLTDLHGLPREGRWLFVGIAEDGLPRLAHQQDNGDWRLTDPFDLSADLRLTSPTLVSVEDRFMLWAVVVPTEGARRLIRLDAEDLAGPWTWGETDLAGGVDCRSSSGQAAPCWDREGPLTFDIRKATTPLGRPIWRLWYTSGSTRSLPGFAASWDGVTWSRFVFNPLLAEEGGQWRWPVALRTPEGALLFGERQPSRGLPRTLSGTWIATGSADTW